MKLIKVDGELKLLDFTIDSNYLKFLIKEKIQQEKDKLSEDQRACDEDAIDYVETMLKWLENHPTGTFKVTSNNLTNKGKTAASMKKIADKVLKPYGLYVYFDYENNLIDRHYTFIFQLRRITWYERIFGTDNSRLSRW